MTVCKLVNSKIRVARARKSIWLQNLTLQATDFQYQTRYNVEKLDTGDGVVFTPCKDGVHKVYGRDVNNPSKPTLPLVEHFSEELNEVFEAHEPVRITVEIDKITVRRLYIESNIERREKRLANKIKRGAPIAGLSLCHGFGGLDHAIHDGLKRSGIASKISIVNELNHKYLNASLVNNSELFANNALILEGDLKYFNPVHGKNEVDYLSIGIPCEASSIAGKTKNGNSLPEQNENVGTIPFYLLNFIMAFNPSFCIVENVDNFVGCGSYYMIKGVMQELGYNVQDRIINGSEFGALENRSRMCLIATSRNISGFDINSVKASKEKESRLGEILDDVPLNDNAWARDFSYLFKKQERDKAKKNGFKVVVAHPDDSQINTCGKGYFKGRSNEPIIPHPEKEGVYRLMNVNENCRSKTIPQSLVSGLSATVAHEALGQSISYMAFSDTTEELGNTLSSWSHSSETIAA